MVAGWFAIWDLAKPVIAQVHGYCLAGGTELATACDLVYVAEDAQIGYPPVRSMSPPDMQYHPWLMGLRGAMEAMLTGDSIPGSAAARWRASPVPRACEPGRAGVPWGWPCRPADKGTRPVPAPRGVKPIPFFVQSRTTAAS